MQWFCLLLFVICLCVYTQCDVPCSNNGVSINGTCKCDPGFEGNECQHCQGRFLLNETKGSLSSGPDYIHFDDCVGVISPSARPNGSILHLDIGEVTATCHCNDLTVYDGDSLYGPIIAKFSGNHYLNRTQQIVTSSKAVTLQFYNSNGDFHHGYVINYRLMESSLFPNKNNQSDLTIGCERSSCIYEWGGMMNQGRASTSVVGFNETLYVFGGITLGQANTFVSFMRLNTSSFKWSEETSNGSLLPEPRWGHTMNKWKNSLLIFGGAFLNNSATNEVWLYNITSSTWRLILHVNETESAPYLIGHSAHMTTNYNGSEVMLIFFGYSPKWRISQFVFEYNIDSRNWVNIKTKGSLPLPTYQHASALDESGNVVYVFGGLNERAQNQLYSYNVENSRWSSLPHSPQPRYLHSMTLLNKKLYIFGGTDSEEDNCEECNPLTFMTYDIDCMEWFVSEDKGLGDRYGHSAVKLNETSLLVYGGFVGTMMSDVIVYTNLTSDCISMDESSCVNSSVCEWEENKCGRSCMKNRTSVCEDLCSMKFLCEECFSTPCECCFDAVCSFRNDSESIKHCNDTSCDDAMTTEIYCNHMMTCEACNEAGCLWMQSESYCTTNKYNQTSTSCGASCEELSNCEECVDQSPCEWCGTTGTCFHQADVDIIFPYTQCQDRVLNTCAENDVCERHQSCDDCFDDYRCGWCDYGSSTGYGACMEGSGSAPLQKECPSEQWEFFKCPACQCNGHSNCSSSPPDVCTACEPGTTGEKCGDCDEMFYGDAINGQMCEPCLCNNHAIECSSKTGTCYCDVEGIVGKNCDICYGGFNGEPVNDTCRYSMEVMVKYSFPLIGESSTVRKFNFESCPEHETDITVKIESIESGPFDVMITMNNSIDGNETILWETFNVTTVSKLLSHRNYKFGKGNCIRIYLSNFLLPTHITIWLLQNFINIVKLVVIFFITLVSLLLVSGAIWKIYLMIMQRQQTQHMRQEAQRLAARPLAGLNMDISDDVVNNQSEAIVAEEKCRSENTAVCTMLLWLPGENTISSPTLALGSCLVSQRSKREEKKSHKLNFHLPMVEVQPARGGIDNPVYVPN